MRLSEVAVPTSAAAELAGQVALAFSPPALVNHCRRSYVFAVTLAASEGLAIDSELLYVATMLHDLGLEPAFDNVSEPFENAGGNVAWVFAAGAGWPERRRERASEIIIAHMRDTDPAVDPEGYALAVATSLDISGREPERWPAELLAETVAAYPRLDLGALFTARFEDQARRKPGCAAAESVGNGIAARIEKNPLESL